MATSIESFSVRIVFVRHAMSIDNEAWRLGRPWPGVRDAPLCEAGRASLPVIAKQLASWQPEKVLSSPLSRCIDTARAICDATNAGLEIDYELAEVFHTDGDKPLLPEDLQANHPTTRVIPPEPWAANVTPSERAKCWLRRLAATRESRRICVVGHRGWLLSVSDLDLENGEVTCLGVTATTEDATNIGSISIRRHSRWW